MATYIQFAVRLWDISVRHVIYLNTALDVFLPLIARDPKKHVMKWLGTYANRHLSYVASSQILMALRLKLSGLGRPADDQGLLLP
jgi:hypothetical protein